MAIVRKSREDMKKMRAAGRVVRKVLTECGQMCRPGVTTREIDEAAQAIITQAGAEGLFKGYPCSNPKGPAFPGNICISVNEVVVHGIGDDRVIQEGDAVGLDCGVRVAGWCGDSATTIMVGQVSDEVRHLCETTKAILDLAIEHIQPGRHWSTIARLMQKRAEDAGLGVVKDFVGHGIGQNMHEQPQIPNYVSPELRRHDIVLAEGMGLAIEPMCNLGTDRVHVLDDDWTVVTDDGKASAHYEHTVAVTADGAEILTDGN